MAHENKFTDLIDITAQVEQAKKELYAERLTRSLRKHGFAEEDVFLLRQVALNDESLFEEVFTNE